MKQKIMVSGGSGFIGSHLVKHLKAKGYKVFIFDWNVKPNMNIISYHIVDKFMEKNKPDVVIHLAGNPHEGTSIKDPVFDVDENIVGTINMLEASVKHNIKLFLFPSTSHVYGDQYFLKSEQDDTHPTTPYSIGKLSAENYINFYHAFYNLPTVIFRLFNVYGEDQKEWAVIPKLIKKMSESKEDKFEISEDSRDFVHVKDVCRAFEKAVEEFDLPMQKQRVGVNLMGETINIGSGRSIPLVKIAQEIAKNLNKTFKYSYFNEGKGTKVEADINKAKGILGYESSIGIEEGIKGVVKWKTI